MSYILDALKQSDQQRKARQPANSQTGGLPPVKQNEGRNKLVPLLAVTLLVFGLAAAWLFTGTLVKPEPAVKVARAEPVVSVVPAPDPLTAAELARLQQVDLSLEHRIQAPPVKAPEREVPAGRPQPFPEPVAEAQSVSLPAQPEAAEPAAEYTDLPYWRQLPVDVQRRLPELSFSVHIYSPDPQARRVKVNGQMLREGAKITPGVRLEAIIPKGVVLQMDGRRFRMGAS